MKSLIKGSIDVEELNNNWKRKKNENPGLYVKLRNDGNHCAKFLCFFFHCCAACLHNKDYYVYQISVSLAHPIALPLHFAFFFQFLQVGITVGSRLDSNWGVGGKNCFRRYNQFCIVLLISSLCLIYEDYHDLNHINHCKI